MKGWLMRALASFTAMLLMSAAPAWAHRPSDAFVFISTENEHSVRAEVEVSLRDLDYVLGLDGDANGEITWGELRASRAALEGYVLPRIRLEQEGSLCSWSLDSLRASRHGQDGYASLGLVGSCAEGGAADRQLRYRLMFDVDPTHKALVTVASGGERHLTVASVDTPLIRLSERSSRQLAEFFHEGVVHILTGYDHMLFLLALLLPAVLVRRGSAWVPVDDLRTALSGVFKVVTAFTVAHSITLALAALQIVNLPSRLVETTIAASVFVAALNNLIPLFDERKGWRVAFFFGLIHGFGFAGVLSEGGAMGASFVKCLLGFNLGVEAGQLALVLAFVPVAYLLRGTAVYRRGVLGMGSCAVLVISIHWCCERML